MTQVPNGELGKGTEIDRHGQRVKDRNKERDRGAETEEHGWKDRPGTEGQEERE